MPSRREVGSLEIDLRVGLAKFAADISSAQRKMSRLGRDFSRFGSDVAKSLTLPIGLAGAAFIKSSVDMNKGMSQIATLISKGGSDINNLKRDIQSLAVSSGKSTTDLAGGMYNVISAFGDAADNAEKLGVAVKASVAGGSSTTDAINLISAATKAYGDTTVAAQQKVSDLAFLAVKLGQTTFPELAANMGKVTGSAAVLKVSQEELFAVFATTTGVVGSTAEAATQLKAVFTNLNKPTKELEQVFASLGVATGEALIETQGGFRKALEAIVKESERLGLNLAKVVGSAEAYNTVVALTGSQSEKFADAIEEMNSAAGSTDKAYKDMTEGANSFGHKLAQLQRQAEVTAQTIGDRLTQGGQLGSFIDTLREGVEELGNFILKFTELDPRVQDAALAFGAIVAAAGAVATAIAGLIAVIGGVFLAKIALVVTAVAGLGAAFYALRDDISAAMTGAWEAFNQQYENFKTGLTVLKNLVTNFLDDPFSQGGSQPRIVQAVEKTAEDMVAAANKEKEIAAIMRQISSDINGAIPYIDHTAQSMGKLTEETAKTGAALENTGKKTDAAGAGLGGVSNEAEKAAKKLAELRAKWNEATEDMKRNSLEDIVRESLRSLNGQEFSSAIADLEKHLQQVFSSRLQVEFGAVASPAELRARTEEMVDNIIDPYFDEYSRRQEEVLKENERAQNEINRRNAESWASSFGRAVSSVSAQFNSQTAGTLFNLLEGFGSGTGPAGAFGQAFGENGIVGMLGSQLGGGFGAIFTAMGGLYGALIGAVATGLAQGFSRWNDDDLKYSTSKEKFQEFDLAVTAGAGSIFGIDSDTNKKVDSFLDSLNEAVQIGNTDWFSLNPVEAFANVLDGFGLLGTRDFGAAVRGGIESGFKDLIEETFDGNGLTINTPDGGVALLDMIHFFGGGTNNKFNDGAGFEFFQSLDANAQNVFQSLAEGFAGIFELPDDFDVNQLAAVLSENLLGDIDNARLFVQALGVDFNDLKDAALLAARQGSISWAEFNQTVAGLSGAFGEGLHAVGDMTKAVENFINSGARGFPAIKGIRDLAVEFLETGASGMDAFANSLLQAGFSAEQVKLFMAELAARGVDTVEELASASEELAGSIAGALDQQGFGFTDVENEIQTVKEAFEELNAVVEDIETTVKVNVVVEGEEALKGVEGISVEAARLGGIFTRMEAFANGGIVNSPTLFNHSRGLGLMGEAGPEAILPLTRVGGKLGVLADGSGGGKSLTINIDARGAEVGVEELIDLRIREASEEIFQGIMQAVEQ